MSLRLTRGACAVALALALPPVFAQGFSQVYFFGDSLTDGGAQTVYLARGEQTVVARAGEVLDSTYKITAITPVQIEFEYIPTGVKQALDIPARDN